MKEKEVSEKDKKKRRTLLIITAIICLIVTVAVLPETVKYGEMIYCLFDSGYGLKGFPKALDVYYGRSDGATIGQNGQNSDFIARLDWDYYEKVLNDNGYFKYDQMGIRLMYADKNGNKIDVYRWGTGHFIKIYSLSAPNTIEYYIANANAGANISQNNNTP